MTSASHAALGVDVGTTNTKVVLIRVGDGTVQEERIHSLATPHRAAELRDAVLGAIRTVATDAPLRIRAIGIASMAETGALLDQDGEPLGELLRWDAGDTAEADALVASVGARELYAATGVPIAAKSPLVHWRSLAAAGDARLRTARWCGIADLIAFALTGSRATDRTLAARTMAYRHGAEARGDADRDGEAVDGFDPDLLALAGLDPTRFPRVLRPGEPAGTLGTRMAAALGLAPGIPVTIAGHDHAVGAWAAGARQPGDAADSVGTAEALYRVAAHVPRERARSAGFSVAPTVDGGHESVLAGNPTAGAFVDWTFRTLLPSVDRGAALEAAATVAAQGPSHIVVLPYLRGRQAPCPDPSAAPRVVHLAGSDAGGVAGLPDAELPDAGLPDAPGEVLAAVLTGLVLQLAWLDAEQSAVLAELRADDLPLLGGPGAADPAWWTLKRMLVPGRLRRVAAAEPVATGAAMLALRDACGIDSVLSAHPDAPLPSPERDRDADPVEARSLLAAFVAAATQPTTHTTTDTTTQPTTHTTTHTTTEAATRAPAQTTTRKAGPE